MKSNPTTSIYLDTRHQKKDNSYPVKLRVCFERKAKFYHAKFNNVNLYLTKEDFDIIMESAKPRGLNKDIKFELVDIEDRAMDISMQYCKLLFNEFPDIAIFSIAIIH